MIRGRRLPDYSLAVPVRTLEDALQALSRLTNYERTRADGPRDFDLARPAGLLERLGAPHRRLGGRVVQVAGTKGKGSTARFLAGIFRAAGLRTGLFTSPHLESVVERIAIDGRPIPEAAFADCVERALAGVEGTTTFFEATLAAACLHFADAGVDAAVLEVGLGGRLDATTAVPTTHNVIAEISIDHTEILGDTIEAIAAEKAATIRPGVPVWSGVDPATPAGAVIEAFAREREAPFTYVPPPADEDLAVERRAVRWRGIRLPVLGRHQAHNAALAAAAAGDLPWPAVAEGLAGTIQPACCEVRGADPAIVVDGAHNLSSVGRTCATLAEHFPGVRPWLVIALARDKDLDGIARELAAAVAGVVCTRADDKRGRPAAELAAHPAWAGHALAEADPAAALARAHGQAGPGGLVLVTGSLYLAGALRSRV